MNKGADILKFTTPFVHCCILLSQLCVSFLSCIPLPQHSLMSVHAATMHYCMPCTLLFCPVIDPAVLLSISTWLLCSLLPHSCILLWYTRCMYSWFTLTYSIYSDICMYSDFLSLTYLLIHSSPPASTTTSAGSSGSTIKQKLTILHFKPNQIL
jgi:hypothetical protein